MKTTLALCLSFGALAASAALNVYHAGQSPEAAAPYVVREGVPQAPCRPRCVLVETLELTPAQKQQFANCCPSFAQGRVQLHRRVDLLVAQLEEELGAEHPDTPRIHQLAKQIGEVHAEELKNRAQCIVLVRKTLTPNQLERLATYCGQE